MKLYESGFFRHYSKTLGIAINQKIKNPESIIGLVLAIKQSNLSLLRQCIVDVFQGEVNGQMLSGLIAMITKDLSGERDIKQVCKKLGLNSGLVLKLLQVTAKWNGDHSIYKGISDLLKGHVGQADIFAELIAVTKGDVVESVKLSNSMAIDNEKLLLTLSCAKGRLDLLDDRYSQLGALVQIQNPDSVQTIMELALGKVSKFDTLQNLGVAQNLKDSGITKALLHISYLGKSVSKNTQRKSLQQEMHMIDKAFDVVSKHLQIILEVDNNNMKAFGLVMEKVKLLFLSVWGWKPALSGLTNEFNDRFKKAGEENWTPEQFSDKLQSVVELINKLHLELESGNQKKRQLLSQQNQRLSYLYDPVEDVHL